MKAVSVWLSPSSNVAFPLKGRRFVPTFSKPPTLLTRALSLRCSSNHSLEPAAEAAGKVSAEPKVGVVVFVMKGKKLLLGRRLVTIGHNMFCPPGGHLEFGETFETCAAREVKEETGMKIDNIELLTIGNNIFTEGTKPPEHRVILYMRSVLGDSDNHQMPQNMEPDKCSDWEWHDWNNLPRPLLRPIDELVQAGFNPFTAQSKPLL